MSANASPRSADELAQIEQGRNRLKKFRAKATKQQSSRQHTHATPTDHSTPTTPTNGDAVAPSTAQLQSSLRWGASLAQPLDLGRSDSPSSPQGPVHSVRRPSAAMGVGTESAQPPPSMAISTETRAIREETPASSGGTWNNASVIGSAAHPSPSSERLLASDRGLAAQLRGEQRRADGLEAELRTARDDLVRERRAGEQIRTELAALRSRAASGGPAVAASEAERHARAELELQLAHVAAELAAMQAAVTELRSANDLLTEQKNSRDRIAARSREELQRARSDIEASAADKGRMIARIEMLQAERDDQAAAMEELSRAVEAQGELVDAVERLERERTEAIAAARRLERSLGSALARVAELENAEDAAADAVGRLERERGEAIAAWEQQADELAQARRRIGELEGAVGRLERELSAERGARENAQRAAERAEEGRAALAAGVERASTAHNELVEQVRSDAQIIARATSQNTELKSRLFELEDRFVAISNERMELTNEVDSLRHKLAQLGHHTPSKKTPRGDVSASGDRLLNGVVQTGGGGGGGGGGGVGGNSDGGSQNIRDDANSAATRPSAPSSQVKSTPTQGQVESSQTPPTAVKSMLERPPSQRSGEPERDDLVEGLYVQIRQLEMERSELIAQLRSPNRQASPASPASGVSNAAQHQRGEGSNGGVSIGSGSGGRVELPALPDGTAPDGAAVNVVTIAQLERELWQFAAENSELQERLEHAEEVNAELVRRLRQEEELSNQLAKETEQVPQLIVLYQQQRQALDEKMAEQEEMLRRAWREVQIRGGVAPQSSSWDVSASAGPSATSNGGLAQLQPNDHLLGGADRNVEPKQKIPTPEPVVPPPRTPRVDPAFIWGDNAELDGNYDDNGDDDEERQAALEKARILAARHRKAVENPWPKQSGIFVL